MNGVLVLAEIEMNVGFSVQGILEKFLPASRAQIKAMMRMQRLFQFGVEELVLLIIQDFADGLQLVVFQIRIRELVIIMRGEDLDFDHVVLMFSGPQILAAEIARNV
jgi:hypothetical protein